MAMSEDQFERYMVMQNSNKEPKTETGIMDSFMKVATTVSATGIMAIIYFLIGMNTNMTVMQFQQIETKNAYTEDRRQDMQWRERVNEFMRAPRFSNVEYAEKELPKIAFSQETREITKHNEQEIEVIKEDLRNMSEDVRIIRSIVDPNSSNKKRNY